MHDLRASDRLPTSTQADPDRATGIGLVLRELLRASAVTEAAGVQGVFQQNSGQEDAMKTILVLIAVLWVGVGGAGNCPADLSEGGEQCWRDAYREYHEKMMGYQDIRIKAEDRTVECLDKMEAAMRAMEEFVYHGDIASVEPLHRMPQAELAREIERLNRRDAARDQWDKAKACWRKL